MCTRVQNPLRGAGRLPDIWRPGSGAMERLAVGLYDGMNLDWLLIVSRRYSIWSMVWKRLALSPAGGRSRGIR